jgi:biotin operon repressor
VEEFMVKPEEDTVLINLKKLGNKLQEMLNISDEDINKAIEELRKDC